MDLDSTPNLWRAALLGVINGLLAGWCASAALWLDLEARRREAQKLTDIVFEFADPLPLSVLLALGGVAFTVASLAVHRALARRVRSVLLLWQCVGLAAVACGILAVLLVISVENIWSEYPTSYGEFVSSSALRLYLAAFALVAALNLLFGSFIRLVTRLGHKRRAAFP